MSEFRKANSDDIYFVTFTVVGWIDVFTNKKYADIIVENLNFYIENQGIEVFTYVIMSNHLHIICRCAKGQKLNSWLRNFKSYTARQLLKSIQNNCHDHREMWMLRLFRKYADKSSQNQDFMFWKKTSHPTKLFSNRVTNQKINYIHNNPVKAGIVDEPYQYVYSSANPSNPVRLTEW